jgi:hypothetical protein
MINRSQYHDDQGGFRDGMGKLTGRSRSAKDLAKADRFCREQFVSRDGKSLRLKSLNRRGERRIFYRFSIVDFKTGDESAFISLGSYDVTTQIARELGVITDSQRLYHIDRYVGGGHETFAFSKTKPSYETVRETVRKIMSGTAEVISGISPSMAP